MSLFYHYNSGITYKILAYEKLIKSALQILKPFFFSEYKCLLHIKRETCMFMGSRKLDTKLEKLKNENLRLTLLNFRTFATSLQS
jgi:hypothetical protein